MKATHSERTGKVICSRCRQGYGSEYDGLCTKCRGRSAYDQKVKDGLISEVRNPAKRCEK